MKRLMMVTVLTLATTSNLVWAQTPAADDPHHPPQAATPASPPAGQQGMMGMMGGMPMMHMMGMMRMMGMMGSDMGGMATIDRIEGRIAFLRTELKITEVQTSAWNAFADALRANAKKLGEMRGSMMPQAGATPSSAPTLAERLDLHERWLLARLEGTRTIKTALATLYGRLSDEQKKTADELLAPHMGMGMMGMMPGQMQPGQMQPGQMRPGKMHPQ
jgi:hypothetical protein